ncbi:MAG: hypothetical protein ACKOU6_07035, partial [Planctomycetota bacterium]
MREPLPALLNDRLTALRSRLLSWQLSGWLLQALGSVAVLATTSFFIDWIWRLDWLYRCLLLLAASSAGLWALARIVRRWRQPPSPLALAGAVEAYLPVSDRVLVSAIELHQLATTRRDSPVLVAATMQRALTIAARTDFADIVDRQRLRRRPPATGSLRTT